jgi:periplasmic divalent cation tolerance protein
MNQRMAHRMVVTTVDSAEAAQRIARGIVEARVGACVQIVGPVGSVYRWDGEVRVEQEWQLWIKTTAAAVDALIAHIEADHPYDVPEVVAIAVTAGSAAYLDWVSAEVG